MADPKYSAQRLAAAVKALPKSKAITPDTPVAAAKASTTGVAAAKTAAVLTTAAGAPSLTALVSSTQSGVGVQGGLRTVETAKQPVLTLEALCPAWAIGCPLRHSGRAL